MQTPVNNDIEWRIIHGNLVYEDECKCIEAMEIQKHRSDFMNGYTGRTITIQHAPGIIIMNIFNIFFITNCIDF